jgi:endonuclease YncB( thermonuclease family)
MFLGRAAVPARRVTAIITFLLGLLAGATFAPVLADRSAADADGAARRSTPAIRGAYAAEVLRVIDGDTFEARVHLWPGLDVTTRVRLRGIDAPELHARCPEERRKAEDTRSVLAALLAQGEITVLRVALDKYGGRVLADAATLRTADVSQALLQQGVVRAYAGGRRAGWCG